jgi:hypothetical protein
MAGCQLHIISVYDWLSTACTSGFFCQKLLGIDNFDNFLQLLSSDSQDSATTLRILSAYFYSTIILLQFCWMAVILFCPVRQLTRRLGFVVLGVLTLVALSEISKLNLHQHLKLAKASENSSPTHILPSHAAA